MTYIDRDRALEDAKLKSIRGWVELIQEKINARPIAMYFQDEIDFCAMRALMNLHDLEIRAIPAVSGEPLTEELMNELFNAEMRKYGAGDVFAVDFQFLPGDMNPYDAAAVYAVRDFRDALLARSVALPDPTKCHAHFPQCQTCFETDNIECSSCGEKMGL